MTEQELLQAYGDPLAELKAMARAPNLAYRRDMLLWAVSEVERLRKENVELREALDAELYYRAEG